MDDRWVIAPGALNLRDLGGIPTQTGGYTRRGMIYRSEFLADPLTHGEQEGVHPLGLRTVVDLRLSREVEHEQVPWSYYGVNWIHRPVWLRKTNSWAADYMTYLEAGPEQFVEVIQDLMDPSNFPVLFHCAAGKDRTGTVAAVILQVAGVSTENIVVDYEQTITNLEPLINRLAKQEVYAEQLLNSHYLDHAPNVEKIQSLLVKLDSEWGGARNWLIEHGLDEQIMSQFLDVFVTDTPATRD